MKVEPIRDIKQIKIVRSSLSGNIRDLFLFEISIQTGLRMSDILKLTIGDLKDKRVGDIVRIIEQKTKKPNLFVINKSIYKTLKRYLDTHPLAKDNDFLFYSRKGSRPLQVSTVNVKIKGWLSSVGLSGNYGCHSLRKTFGFIQRTIYGVSVEVLSRRYQHSSIRTTMIYLGINEDEVRNVLLNDI